IAIFYLLAKKGIVKTGIYTQETKAGLIRVEVKREGVVLMNHILPKLEDILDKNEIAESLNIPIDSIIKELPIQIFSSVSRDILIPIISIKALNRIKPNFEMIKKISKKYGTYGYHLFTQEKSPKISCRNFAPLYNIPEESASGTSICGLSCYLFKYGIINEKRGKNLVFEQGYSMGKPSSILTSLIFKNHKIIEVKVGGKATNIQIKEIK
ncbi:MAG: PhzF family phenazine biosynthesis isomerase, partial [Nanoarchaeota archaeon]